MGDNNDVKLDPTIDFIAGIISGINAVIVGYPLDTVKVRLQDAATASKYKSTINATAIIVREEGVRGLFKGITSPLAAAGFLNGLVFSSYGLFTRLQLTSRQDVPSLFQIFLAGCGTGMVATTLICPMELIKIRQQIDLSTGRQPSAFSVARDIFKRQGLRGLYRGIVPTGFREIGYGAYFWSYEGTCRLFRNVHAKELITDNPETSLVGHIDAEVSKLSFMQLMAAGSLAGIVGWLATFPFDVIKTRMQSVDHNYLKDSPYNHTWTAIRHCYNSEGYRVFFRGLAPTLYRSVPVNAVVFGSFEQVVRILS